MGNYSADPTLTLKSAYDHGYSRVRFQQGKPILDRELNLAVDLASPQQMTQQYIGDGVPDGSGFQITGLNVPGNDFVILPGRCVVGGREVVLANQTTYKGQPNNAHVSGLPVGISNVYLHVFTIEITSAQDAALANPNDVAMETSVREKVDWEVLVSAAPINTSDHHLLAILNTGIDTVFDRRRSGLTLAAVRDEITVARGAAATLDARLKATDQAIDSVQGEITTARGTAAQLNDRLNASLNPDGTVKAGAVSVQRMASTLVINTQVAIPGAAAGQPAEQTVTLTSSDNPEFLLVSVHFDGPRIPLPPSPVVMSQALGWRYQVTLLKPPFAPTFTQHLYQIVIQNPNASAISVTVKAYRLAEV